MRKNLYDIHNRLEKELTKDILYKKYIIENSSSNKIAKIFNCNNGVILRYLRKFKISIKNNSESKIGIKLITRTSKIEGVFAKRIC